MLIDLLNNNGLLKCSCINFKTNTLSFCIDYSVSDNLKGNFPQASLKMSEIQLLYKLDNQWRNYEEILHEGMNKINLSSEKEWYEIECIIYLPILSDLNKLNLILPDGCCFEYVTEKKNLLVAGGVHSFGMGCTSSGTLFSNIISRKMELNPLQLTFYDRNFLDKIHNFLNEEDIPSFDYGILELDYSNQDDFIVDNYLVDVVNLMLRHCNRLICWFTLPEGFDFKKNKLFNYLEPYLTGKNLILRDMSILYNQDMVDMCTSSNNFLNDNGNILIYKRISRDMGLL